MKQKKIKRDANSRADFTMAASDAMQNSAATLLANIGFSGIDEDVKSVVVTSSIPNEGKTTVAMALAIAMTRSDKNCLILECDMRRRSLRTTLGARSRHGLCEVLTGRCPLNDAVVKVNDNGLYFLDAESGIPNPDALLASARFKQMLESLKSKFDYIVLDTPPVTSFPDAAIAARIADGTLLVLREGYTEMHEAELAVEQLRSANANIIGAVFNGVKHSAGAYSYSYNYHYYYNDSEESADQDAPSVLDGEQPVGELPDRKGKHSA